MDRSGTNPAGAMAGPAGQAVTSRAAGAPGPPVGPPGQLAVLELGSTALPRLTAIACRVQPGHAGPAATGSARPPDVPGRGGLAGAAGPGDREDLAFLRGAGHVAQAHRAAVALVMVCTSVTAGTGRQVQRRNHGVPAAWPARPCPGGRELIRGIDRLAPRIHRSAGPPPAGSSFARTPGYAPRRPPAPTASRARRT
jgi:hypothetical protein